MPVDPASMPAGEPLLMRSDGLRRNLQDRSLRRLIRHAYHNVAYYRRLMDQHGIQVEAIRGVPDLERFPVTRKRDLQALPLADRLAAGAEPSRLIVHSTSGSTGQPFQVYRSWLEERLLGSYRWRVLARYGYRPGHRHAEIEELQPQNNGDRRGLHEGLGRLGLFRQRRIHCLQEPRAILDELVSAAPDALTGYAGVVSRVAAAALSSGETRIQPNFVGVHSDQLTAGMRQEIGKAFQAPVFEIYDAYELNVIAWECPTGGGLHTSDATAVVQVLDDRGPVAEGAQGEVVLTALHSLNMPFIRYSAGDLARRASPCPCGRPGRLSSVDGRTVEYFALPDGRVVHPYEVYARLGDVAWITQYQWVQDRPDSFTLYVVPKGPVPDAQVFAVEARITAFLGPRVGFQLKQTNSIALGSHGKSQAFRSLVATGLPGGQAATG